MAAKWVEKVTGSLEDKKRWRAYKARKEQLPAPYRAMTDALERYCMYAGGITDGDLLMTMHEDLMDLVERAAADGTPIRDVVGADPVEFAEEFIANYSDGGWLRKERTRLTEAITKAESDQSGTGS
jgi:DNA-binding ferritin-like protein (Dps family)